MHILNGAFGIVFSIEIETFQGHKMAKHKAPPRKKVGRNWYVCDIEDKIVEGLSFDTGNGYYFYSGWRKEAAVKQKKKTRKDYQFGRDYDEPRHC